jgi:hypothetical protein
MSETFRRRSIDDHKALMAHLDVIIRFQLFEIIFGECAERQG